MFLIIIFFVDDVCALIMFLIIFFVLISGRFSGLTVLTNGNNIGATLAPANVSFEHFPQLRIAGNGKKETPTTSCIWTKADSKLEVEMELHLTLTTNCWMEEQHLVLHLTISRWPKPRMSFLKWWQWRCMRWAKAVGVRNPLLPTVCDENFPVCELEWLVCFCFFLFFFSCRIEPSKKKKNDLNGDDWSVLVCGLIYLLCMLTLYLFLKDIYATIGCHDWWDLPICWLKFKFTTIFFRIFESFEISFFKINHFLELNWFETYNWINFFFVSDKHFSRKNWGPKSLFATIN